MKANFIITPANDDDEGPTISTLVTILCKKCNPQIITISPEGSSGFKNPIDSNNAHRIFQQGNTLVFQALDTAISVHRFDRSLSISISTKVGGSGINNSFLFSLLLFSFS